MYSYSFSQWLLFFYIYCFLGWCIESTIVSFEQKKLVNRGFLRIPLLPIYGSGAVTVLFVTIPVQYNVVLVYLVGMIAATILEYFTGWLMESTLKVKYWDYSNDKFNYKGRICLVSSLFWGVLSIVLTLFIHKPIEEKVLSMNENTVLISITLISVVFIGDFIHSIKTSLDLNKLLSEVTRIKGEIEALKNNTSLQLHIRQIPALKSKLDKLNKEYEAYTEKIRNSTARVFKAYPTATSMKFNEALKEIREKLKGKVE